MTRPVKGAVVKLSNKKGKGASHKLVKVYHDIVVTKCGIIRRKFDVLPVDTEVTCSRCRDDSE